MNFHILGCFIMLMSACHCVPGAKVRAKRLAQVQIDSIKAIANTMQIEETNKKLARLCFGTPPAQVQGLQPGEMIRKTLGEPRVLLSQNQLQLLLRGLKNWLGDTANSADEKAQVIKQYSDVMNQTLTSVKSGNQDVDLQDMCKDSAHILRSAEYKKKMVNLKNNLQTMLSFEHHALNKPAFEGKPILDQPIIDLGLITLVQISGDLANTDSSGINGQTEITGVVAQSDLTKLQSQFTKLQSMLNMLPEQSHRPQNIDEAQVKAVLTDLDDLNQSPTKEKCDKVINEVQSVSNLVGKSNDAILTEAIEKDEINARTSTLNQIHDATREFLLDAGNIDTQIEYKNKLPIEVIDDAILETEHFKRRVSTARTYSKETLPTDLEFDSTLAQLRSAKGIYEGASDLGSDVNVAGLQSTTDTVGQFLYKTRQKSILEGQKLLALAPLRETQIELDKFETLLSQGKPPSEAVKSLRTNSFAENALQLQNAKAPASIKSTLQTVNFNSLVDSITMESLENKGSLDDKVVEKSISGKLPTAVQSLEELQAKLKLRSLSIQDDNDQEETNVNEAYKEVKFALDGLKILNKQTPSSDTSFPTKDRQAMVNWIGFLNSKYQNRPPLQGRSLISRPALQKLIASLQKAKSDCNCTMKNNLEIIQILPEKELNQLCGPLSEISPVIGGMLPSQSVKAEFPFHKNKLDKLKQYCSQWTGRRNKREVDTQLKSVSIDDVMKAIDGVKNIWTGSDDGAQLPKVSTMEEVQSLISDATKNVEETFAKENENEPSELLNPQPLEMMIKEISDSTGEITDESKMLVTKQLKLAKEKIDTTSKTILTDDQMNNLKQTITMLEKPEILSSDQKDALKSNLEELKTTFLNKPADEMIKIEAPVLTPTQIKYESQELGLGNIANQLQQLAQVGISELHKVIGPENLDKIKKTLLEQRSIAELMNYQPCETCDPSLLEQAKRESSDLSLLIDTMSKVQTTQDNNIQASEVANNFVKELSKFSVKYLGQMPVLAAEQSPLDSKVLDTTVSKLTDLSSSLGENVSIQDIQNAIPSDQIEKMGENLQNLQKMVTDRLPVMDDVIKNSLDNQNVITQDQLNNIVALFERLRNKVLPSKRKRRFAIIEDGDKVNLNEVIKTLTVINDNYGVKRDTQSSPPPVEISKVKGDNKEQSKLTLGGETENIDESDNENNSDETTGSSELSRNVAYGVYHKNQCHFVVISFAVLVLMVSFFP